MSDWGAVYHRVPALTAGLDLEMPPNWRSPDQIVAAVHAGELDEELLDDRVRMVLELVDKGMTALELDEDFDPDEHHRLALAAFSFLPPGAGPAFRGDRPVADAYWADERPG